MGANSSGLTVNSSGFYQNTVNSSDVYAGAQGNTALARAFDLAHGGGVFFRGGSLTVNSSQFGNYTYGGNHAYADGATAYANPTVLNTYGAYAYSVAAGGGLFVSAAGSGSSQVNTSGFYYNSVLAMNASAASPNGNALAVAQGGGGAVGHGACMPYKATNGTLTVYRSTLAYNTAEGTGGDAGYTGGYGGGGFNNAGTLILKNSTVTDNTAGSGANPYGYGGGVANIGGTTRLIHATVAGSSNGANPGNYAYGNGGGIFNGGGSFTLQNTLVANNQVGGSGADSYGSFNGSGVNLVENPGGGGGVSGSVIHADPNAWPAGLQRRTDPDHGAAAGQPGHRCRHQRCGAHRPARRVAAAGLVRGHRRLRGAGTTAAAAGTAGAAASSGAAAATAAATTATAATAAAGCALHPGRAVPGARQADFRRDPVPPPVHYGDLHQSEHG